MTIADKSMRRLVGIIASSVLAVAACSEQAVPVGADADAGPSGVTYSLVSDIFPTDTVAVDILFVVDNSASMGEEQASLAAWARDSLFGVLELDPATPLDLHVAVVSTDVGAGAYGLPGCEDIEGDNGVMNQKPGDNSCSPPSGPYIVDVADGVGGRTKNYAGTLEDTFSCIARIGVQGCGFEQPLEAMKRALDGSNAQNDGFLRPDALLAVVIVSDEDDCSVADVALFDSRPAAEQSLGPLSSFRCFEFGVVCDADDPRTPGDKSGCRTRDDSAYVAGLTHYADFLKALKDDPSKVVVAGIFGDPNVVVVQENEQGHPALATACSAGMGSAYPGVRLAAFLDMFPARNRFANICDGDMGGPLRSAAMGINETARRSPCLYGDLRDAEPQTPGLQAICRVVDVVDAARTDIVACADNGAAAPCFTLAADTATCGHTRTQLAVNVTRSVAAPGHTLVECVTRE